MKDFVIYRVHIHKTKQEELYKLLESMPKSTRGLYIREALEYYHRTHASSPDAGKTPGISFRGAFDQEF
ncbi:MAG: hypothetical protein A4E63_03114 [Syntrophorhabdus sp. PtaU1.Bin050]|jgi:hypothetical protein|nr:MAG: hypothetical protein A4E63_03114 [Syntrophorhabdus sp. PtaU1.Bin050]